jgi:hypothetical protein
MRNITICKSIVLVAILGTILFYFLGTPAPKVSLSPDAGLLSFSRDLTLKLDAQGGILKKLTVTAIQGEKTVNVLTKDFPLANHQATETFNLAKTGLKEGAFTLQVNVTSSAPRFGANRTTTLVHPFTLDTKPLEVAVVSVAHNIIQGGAGLVVYTASKEVEKTGVVCGDQFFPGYRQGGNYYVCLFPFPYDMEPGKFVPKLIAVDRAGNERLLGINCHLIAKSFSTDRMSSSKRLPRSSRASSRKRELRWEYSSRQTGTSGSRTASRSTTIAGRPLRRRSGRGLFCACRTPPLSAVLHNFAPIYTKEKR